MCILAVREAGSAADAQTATTTRLSVVASQSAAIADLYTQQQSPVTRVHDDVERWAAERATFDRTT